MQSVTDKTFRGVRVSPREPALHEAASRVLPFLLSRKTHIHPARKRLCLELTDAHRGLVRIQRSRAARSIARPTTVRLCKPILRHLDVLLSTPSPTGIAPELAAMVSPV